MMKYLFKFMHVSFCGLFLIYCQISNAMDLGFDPDAPAKYNPFMNSFKQALQLPGQIAQMQYAPQEEQARLQQMELQNQLLEEKVAEEQQVLAQAQVNQGDEIKQHVAPPIQLMIFSQEYQPVYLGCITCSANAIDSVENPESTYSSKTGSESVYNHYSRYGSYHSDFSPCNPHATHPPIIIDNNSVKYGLLTLNTKLPHAINHPILLKWLRTQVCSR